MDDEKNVESVCKLNGIYNINATVNYMSDVCIGKNTECDYNDDKITNKYQQQLCEVFYIEDETQFIKQTDALYDTIENYDNCFMDYLILNILSENKFKEKKEITVKLSNTKDLKQILGESHVSNSLYFYLMCSSLKTLNINSDDVFNVYDYILNEEFKKLVFGLLFSFQCFQYIHALLVLWVNAKENEYETILNSLSSSFNDMFIS